MARLQDKVALVTGGASGIGAATAERFAAEGARVVASDIDEVGGEAVAEAIRGAGGAAEFLAHDTTDEAAWRAVIDRIVAAHGRLDVLVNSAGIGIAKPILETSLADWRATMSVNLDGVFLGTRIAIEAMSRTGGGSIINLSSAYGMVGGPNVSAYAASKGGVRLLSKAAAVECARAKLGIRVNSVHPGFIETPMVQAGLERSGAPEERRRHIEGLHPVGHLGEPADIANAILYLASDEAKFVTGTELVVDGGLTAW